MQIQQSKTMTKKSKEELKEIILSDDSNLNLPEVSYPSSYTTQPVKLGAKSTEQQRASEHELLEYQRRVNRRDSTLTPEEIRNLISVTNERRKVLQQSINEQKQEFEQRRADELADRRIKQREEERALRIKNENDTQRQMRLASEEDLKNQRAKELQAVQNKSRKEKGDVETLFLQSSNRFNEKYLSMTKKVSGDTGIDRIISSRPFSTNRYAHRCIVCGYHNPESLSISKIYQHIYENKDSHMQFALSEIDKNYNALIADTRRRHAEDDNPDLRRQKLSKDLEALRKLKGAKYR
jgi:hypothetical protein